MQLACGGRVAYTSVTRDDFQRTGAVPPDTEDLVNFTLTLAGVEVGLFFVEQLRGGVKVSFRSRNALDCSRLAETFGGGGHRQAAGAILHEPLEDVQRRVLAAVEAALKADAAR
jgi:phosphoesterase RecJ-like protein